MGRTWPKKHKMALISEYLAADLSPDASADALDIINISYLALQCRVVVVVNIPVASGVVVITLPS